LRSFGDGAATREFTLAILIINIIRISRLVALVALMAMCNNLQVRGDVISADNSNIQYSDVARVTISPTQASFDRIIDDEPIYNLRYDNPAARIRFRTDATSISADLVYNGLHALGSAIEGTGVILRDGARVGAFTSATRPGAVNVALPTTGGLHDYEIVLPYADSVDFKQLNVNAGATFAAPAPRPSTRYIAYGDSITQGYYAADAMQNYASLLGAAKNWQTINMGFGGRKATASDGTVVGSLNADVITMMIGFNDAAQGRPLADYSTSLRATVVNIRAAQPNVPIFMISPIWTSNVDLSAVRTEVLNIVTDFVDPNLHFIDGLTLIPNNASYFTDGIHPNTAGQAIMAENLASAIAIPEPAVVSALILPAVALAQASARRISAKATTRRPAPDSATR
jgi:lysophospholipase L1-like esterase